MEHGNVEKYILCSDFILLNRRTNLLIIIMTSFKGKWDIEKTWTRTKTGTVLESFKYLVITMTSFRVWECILQIRFILVHVLRDSVDSLYKLLHTKCNKIFLKSQGYGEMHRFPWNSAPFVWRHVESNYDCYFWHCP